MAQILKFEGGGPTSGKITYNGVEIPITNEIVQQYRTFGNGYHGTEKAAFNTFLNTVKKGLTDPTVNINIDTDSGQITGVDWDGPNKDIKALHRDQGQFGEIITQLFRPKVKAIKQVGHELTQFNPEVLNVDYTKWDGSEKIILNHKYNDTSGALDKTQFQDNQPIDVARSRLLWFKDVDNLDVTDVIAGYDGIGRKDISEKVKTIGDYNEWITRLFNGTYTEPDEKLANYFGIFFDEDTASDRETLTEQYTADVEKTQQYRDAGFSRSDFLDENTQPVDGQIQLDEEGENLINVIRRNLNLGNDVPLWLNADFFGRYPEYSRWNIGGKNGIFIFGNRIYNADEKNFNAEDEIIFKSWVEERKKTGDSDKIWYKWYDKIDDLDLVNQHFTNTVTEQFRTNDLDFIGAHIPYLTYDGNLVYRRRTNTFDEFGSPYEYWAKVDGEMVKITNPQYTDNLSETKISALEILEDDLEEEPIYIYGKTEGNGIDWVYFANYGCTLGFKYDAEGNVKIYRYINEPKEADFNQDNKNYFANWYKAVNPFKKKRGGKIQKMLLGSEIPEEDLVRGQQTVDTASTSGGTSVGTDGTTSAGGQQTTSGVGGTTGGGTSGGVGTGDYSYLLQTESLKRHFPLDLLIGIGGETLANIHTRRYFNKMHEAYKKNALGQLPVKPTTIYPNYNDNGLYQKHNAIKQRILNTKTAITSDHIANLQSELSKQAMLSQHDNEYNSNFSKSIGDYKNTLIDIQQKEAIANAERESMTRKIFAGIYSNKDQMDAQMQQKQGENLQKFIREMREKREKEITRRTTIEDKMMQYKIQETYNNILASEFNRLGGVENELWNAKKAQYNNDIYAFMKGEYPQFANKAMSLAVGNYWEYVINDGRRTLFPMGRWNYPHSTSSQEGTGQVTTRSIPLHVDGEEAGQTGVQTQKMGGKLKYVKTLYEYNKDNNSKLLDIISKV